MMQQNSPDLIEPEEQAPPPKYRIDEAWYETHGRSLEEMIASRAREAEGGDGAARKRKQAAPSMADLAKIQGFVRRELPVLEAVFRLLLVHENRPMDVEQISQELAERGIGILDARMVGASNLIRLLRGDNYYGLRQVKED